jgi:hypothetical protein
MKIPSDETEVGTNTLNRARLGLGSWTILAVLVLLLVATGFIVYFGWTLASNANVTASGYIAMALGVIFSLIFGCGLMALLFYSSRHGYDEPPRLIVPNPHEAVADDRDRAQVAADIQTEDTTLPTADTSGARQPTGANKTDTPALM